VDVKNLFDGLAKYLDFLLDLFLLSGVQKYAKQGEVSGELVSFFVAGLLVAYLVSGIDRVPGYETLLKHSAPRPGGKKPRTNFGQKSDDPISKPDMAQFAIVSILGGLLLHGFLLVYAQLAGDPRIGSVKETLNAVFAYNALYHPFNAVALQLQRGARSLAGTTRAASILAAVTMLLIAVAHGATVIYLIYPLAALHGTTMTHMLWLCLAFLMVVLAGCVLILLALGLSPKSLLSRRRKQQQGFPES
jgi:hypothetical protein